MEQPSADCLSSFFGASALLAAVAVEIEQEAQIALFLRASFLAMFTSSSRCLSVMPVDLPCSAKLIFGLSSSASRSARARISAMRSGVKSSSGSF